MRGKAALLWRRMLRTDPRRHLRAGSIAVVEPELGRSDSAAGIHGLGAEDLRQYTELQRLRDADAGSRGGATGRSAETQRLLLGGHGFDSRLTQNCRGWLVSVLGLLCQRLDDFTGRRFPYHE